MAFTKLYKIIADSPVGFQTFNAAGANLDEMRTQMFIGHGQNEPQPNAPTASVDYARLGRHNLEEVARTVGNLVLTIQPNLSLLASLGWTGVGIPFVWKVSTGVYYLPVIGLSQWFVTGVANAGATVTYLPPQLRSFYATATNNGNAGVWASTYALDTGLGDFVPVDSAFSFALYGVV